MIYELIYKYLDNEASEKEVLQVFNWIEESEKNKTEFIKLKKIWVLSASNSETKNLYEWNLIKQKIPTQKKIPSSKKLKYVATIIILIAGLSYLTNLSFTTKEPKTIETKKYVVLEKSSGKVEYISENNEKIIKDTLGNIVSKQSNKEIVYYNNPTIKTLTYNTIKVPFSKTYKVVLSDGTIVHLNAGTTFTYPEQFNVANTRKVVLKGEAYFEVFKDKNKPFIVEVNDVNIQVLGTTFNVTNYDEDSFINCVLKEGSVRLSAKEDQENSIVLKPNEKATWQKNARKFTRNQVNPNNYDAWINGELVFNKESFSDIAKKIERYYDVKIINNYALLGSQVFTGTIKINEASVETILDLFKLDTPFNYIKNNTTIEIFNP
ncbi:FecR domain-containing protein [uncultured Polaribacter sp.]|uniref:FecR family protein n=1 Tax=uncultured Polaribacter sp. TaxID=174711 RepID=UPI0030DC9E6C|tara:strand:+ start:316 stop:1449 length:1134 start_codon:yes stop_codon:yes gene_type:complete